MPTDFIVKAENQNGIIAPITKQDISIGSSILTSFNFVLVTKAPKSASDTRQADPIANPLPIAAVVFPAASSASVMSLTSNSAISLIPPALSEMGPYASIARLVLRFDSIPKAAIAIPYIPANLKEAKIVPEIQMIGITQE